MNFLVTSLTITARIALNDHLDGLGILHWGTKSLNEHNFMAYNTDMLSPHFFATENVLAACSTLSAEASDVDNVAESLVNQGGCFGRFSLDHAKYSCIVLNSIDNSLCLVTDSAGSLPLWYALPNEMDMGTSDKKTQEYIVTTDLVAAARFGFKNISPLGPGQAMMIDLTSNEITSLSHWTPIAATAGNDDVLVDYSLVDSTVYSKTLISAALYSMNALAADFKDKVYFTEVDKMHPSSLLLDCTADALELTRGIRFTRPLVEHAEAMVSPDVFGRFLDPVRDWEVQSTSALRQATYSQIAAERWQVCKAASLSSAILLSFESGRGAPRPIETYFQNVFCRLLNVSVVYPFAEAELQRAAWSVASHVSDSMFEQAVPVLRTNGVCNTTTAPEDKSRHFNLKRDSGSCDGIHYHGCVDQFVVHELLSSGPNEIIQDRFSLPITNVIAHATPRAVSALWREANLHSTEDGFIVLVLATAGYLDLLENFFHSVSALEKPFHHILIITPDEEVAALSRQHNMGVFVPRSTMETNTTTTTKAFADFGTLSYQQLILERTECAMELLMLGFKPIIADIDTVWLRNPLDFIEYPTRAGPVNATGHPYQTYDIAFTDDVGEVCGCFVVLTNTPHAIHFWRTVLQRHRDLVVNATVNGAGLLKEFADSEQKILTDLLYKKQYKYGITARLLSKRVFPPGFQYFNRHVFMDSALNLTMPAIVHNNFLIGRQMKITRFQRYNMWKSREGFASDYSGTEEVPAQFDLSDALQSWKQLFTRARKNVGMPSLTVILPLHDSSVVTVQPRTAPMMIQMLKEGIESKTGKKLSVWLENDPLSLLTFGSSAIFDVNIKSNNTVGAFTGMVHDTNVEISVDMLFNRSHFSSLMHPHRANEVVLRRIREHDYNTDREVIQSLADAINIAPFFGDGVCFDVASGTGDRTITSNLVLEYKIKVLAFKRPASLSRLLDSLAAADYMGLKVGLEILIDGFSVEEDAPLVKESQRIASQYHWPHGEKSVVARVKNFGLGGQWHYSWAPSSEREVAFIFEDDIEVSPYFFVWAHRAATKYYANDSAQVAAHWKLLDAVRAHIKGNHSEDESGRVAAGSPLDEFNRLFAGHPLLYGVCLQSQHLDPLHFPKKLTISNGHRPFLYSLIGSWGPAMFPLPWQAFKEWWTWRSSLTKDVRTESIVVNHFRKSNKKNWTPWHVRFSYESGLKCLYSNLPDSYGLVANHREAGENYATLKGPSSTLLSSQTLLEVSQGSSGDGRESDQGAERRRHKALRWSLLHLPDLFHLERWQYDLHVRRPGALGLDRLFRLNRTAVSSSVSDPALTASLTLSGNGEVSVPGSETDEEMDMALDSFDASVRWFDQSMTLLSTFSSSLTPSHWLYVLGMLEAHLLPDARLLHLGVNPLIPSLSRHYLSHTLMAPSAHCESLTASHHLSSVLCISTDLPVLPQPPVDVIVANMPFLLHLAPEGTPPVGHSLWQLVSVPEFILVLLDVCSSAPTDLEIEVTEGEGKKVYLYSLVEDVCNEGIPDVGAVLLRQISRTSTDGLSHQDDRFALSRRYEGGLVARTIIQQRNVSTFD